MPRISRTRHHRETIEFRGAARAVGRIVRALRLDRGWTVEQAAGHFGIEPAFVRRIESGRTNPSLAILVSIARAFATSLGGLVSRGRSGKGAR